MAAAWSSTWRQLARSADGGGGRTGTGLPGPRSPFWRSTGPSPCSIPNPNLKIGSGIPPIPALLAAGVPCAIGTDGASTNDNLILQEAMQLVAILHRASEPDRRRWVTVGDAIGMATLGGAQAMLEPELGRISEGSKA